MTLHEKLALRMKSLELEKDRQLEEAERVRRQIPMPPYLAKNIKDVWKARDWLKKSGWNLSEAEAEFGPGWLDR